MESPEECSASVLLLCCFALAKSPFIGTTLLKIEIIFFRFSNDSIPKSTLVLLLSVANYVANIARRQFYSKLCSTYRLECVSICEHTRFARKCCTESQTAHRNKAMHVPSHNKNKKSSEKISRNPVAALFLSLPLAAPPKLRSTFHARC